MTEQKARCISVRAACALRPDVMPVGLIDERHEAVGIARAVLVSCLPDQVLTAVAAFVRGWFTASFCVLMK